MKNNKIFRSISLFFAVLIFVLPVQQASAEGGLEIGLLKCSVVPGSRVNLLIRSTADINCTFNDQGTMEMYSGETGIALGLDLGFKTDEQMAFAVIAASSDTNPGSYALEGRYIGASASATVGVGVGAKVLVGGGDKNLSLQPLALEANKGFGASAGLGFLYLERAR